MKQQIVLISGKQGSGKSTLQKALHEGAYRAGFKRSFCLNFADTLYQMHDAVLNIVREKGISPPFEKDGKLLQLLGTEWGRSVIGENVWVDILKHEILNLREVAGTSSAYSPQLVIVADCRFRNEFDAFPGALRVRLEASQDTRQVRTNSWRKDTFHPSEVDLDGYTNQFDMVLHTDHTGKDAYALAQDIFDELRRDTYKAKRPAVELHHYEPTPEADL